MCFHQVLQVVHLPEICYVLVHLLLAKYLVIGYSNVVELLAAGDSAIAALHIIINISYTDESLVHIKGYEYSWSLMCIQVGLVMLHSPNTKTNTSRGYSNCMFHMNVFSSAKNKDRCIRYYPVYEYQILSSWGHLWFLYHNFTIMW